MKRAAHTDRLMRFGRKAWLVRVVVMTGIMVPALAIVWMGLAQLKQALTAREAARRQIIVERDLRFAHALAHGVAVYVEAAKDAVEVVAAEAAARPATAAGMRSLAENFVDNSSAFFAVSVADASGKSILTYDPAGKTDAAKYRTGIDISDRRYYKELLATKETVVSEAISSRLTPVRPTFAVAAPYFDADGEVRGLVAAGVSLAPMYDLALKELGDEPATPVVFDHLGQLLVHPDQRLLDAHAAVSDHEPARRALAGEDGFLETFTDLDGAERSAAYAPVPGLGWGVWIAQETRTGGERFIQAELRQTMVFYGLILALDLLLALAFWRLLGAIFAMHRKERAFLTSIGDGVIAIDRAWKITLWNPVAAKLTGWSEAEALGAPFRERVKFIRESDRKENLTFIEESMLYGETRPMSNSTLLLSRDGREIPVGDSAAPIFDEEGDVVGVIVVFRDVTREKDAAILRTDFAYASHQLRTPVNKALWDLELTLDEAGPPKLKERLGVAYRSILDVQKLANRLLDVSMIDQRQIVPEYEETDVASLLKNAADAARRTADARGVRVEISSVPAGLTIDTDPKLLRMALAELIENAALYGHPGMIVDVSAKVGKLDILFRVRDEGVGIPQEQQPLIFTKFFRGQNIPEDAPGAGLGLFIVRAYVRLLGGKIWFDSRRDKGAAFFVSIPRVRGMKE